GAVNLISFAPGTTYDLSEAMPAGWDLVRAGCTINGVPTGNKSGNAIADFEIKSGLETVCSFTDSKGQGDNCPDDPVAETCNGLDDDCDGLIDEGGNALCNDSLFCTDDVCNGTARCSHSAHDGSAETDQCNVGACDETNDRCVKQPAHVGEACGSASDTDCDNPDTCDSQGHCQDNHEADGTSCTSDGIECTQDVCAAGGCTH